MTDPTHVRETVREAVVHVFRHTCHARGCDEPVPPRLLMCRAHWRMVPKRLKDAVWQHYRRGQEVDKRPTVSYLDAAGAAIKAVAAKEARARARAAQGELFG